MKKIIIVAAALLAGFVANAQSIWLTGSYINEKYSATALGITTTGTENGFIAGVEYDFDINDWFTIAPAFTVNGLFGKDELSKDNYFGIEIPIYLRGTYNINKDLGIFAQVAPDLSVGLFDNVTVGSADPVDVIGDELKRVGVYAVFGAGIEIKNAFRVFANYSIGITDRSAIDNITGKSNCIDAGIAFGF